MKRLMWLQTWFSLGLFLLSLTFPFRWWVPVGFTAYLVSSFGAYAIYLEVKKYRRYGNILTQETLPMGQIYRVYAQFQKPLGDERPFYKDGRTYNTLALLKNFEIPPHLFGYRLIPCFFLLGQTESLPLTFGKRVKKIEIKGGPGGRNTQEEIFFEPIEHMDVKPG